MTYSSMHNKGYNMKDHDKVILTDCDGVLLNWEYAFYVWAKRHGYEAQPDTFDVYDLGRRFNINDEEKNKLCKLFNESAAIGFLPPLRDAIHYIRKLHEEHGYVFHCITSLSLEPAAQELRTQNIKKLFGETAFEKFVYLDTGAPKETALAAYAGTGYTWIEDLLPNARAGAKYGLDSILVEHAHNMNNTEYPTFKDWKEIYEYIAG